ncbi:type 1 glutamine amidotransferase domain-containing protein [Pseudonocardia acaciae]|uniref:type 1 glutamine amidotransferase domain-containing protein n=1 Tax=Pseudonocardia acaciae TaxID=551276 RepID=UPI00048ABC81|nr:type 1 glutamine amidotransferase domain-containing protein [Pseudonocardia acaciae]
MTRVLIALTSHEKLGETGEATGYHAGEAAIPWQVFTDAGLTVEFVAVSGGTPPVTSRDDNDPVQRRYFAHAAPTDAPKPGEVSPADYAAIFFAGGHGTMWDFPHSAELARLTADIYQAGGIVGAVCHGPAALVNVTLADGSHLVTGKRVAAFTNAEEQAVGATGVVPFSLADELVARGAEHVPGPDFAERVISDGRLVTGQNPASARGVAERMVAALAAR